MPDITDPQAVLFCNQHIRTIADQLARTYYKLSALRDQWVALGMSSKIPNDTSPIVDGSATDGRPPITGADVHLIAARATEILNDYAANSNAKLNTVLKVSPNPTRG